MIIIGHQCGNVIGLDTSGQHHARIICSPLILGLEPPRHARKPFVIPSYRSNERQSLRITGIKDHWPVNMDTRAYHEDMEQRKKETTEKLRQEVNLKHKEA